MIPFQLTDCNQRKNPASRCLSNTERSALPRAHRYSDKSPACLARHFRIHLLFFCSTEKEFILPPPPPLANAPQAARVRISCTCAELLIFTTGTTILLCLYRIRNQHKSQLLLYGNTAQFPPCGKAPLRQLRHGICVAKMLDNVGLRYPHRASGAKAPRTLRPLPLLRFAVSATGGAHLCSIQYYRAFWLGICRTSLAVSALRIMRYCLINFDASSLPAFSPIFRLFYLGYFGG